MRIPALVRAAAAAWVLAAATATPAQNVEDVFPLVPADRAVVGVRPRFQIGVKGSDLGKMRFRIEISRDDFDTVAYSYDQQADKNGWAFTGLGGEMGAMYVTREALPGGSYKWRVSAWNGIEWVVGRKTLAFTVDTVPPAEIQSLRMRWDREQEVLSFEWDPVVSDRDGGPENVVKYHIYRYTNRPPFFVVRPFRIGETQQTFFEDRGKILKNAPLLYYIVNAVDAADNEPGRRY